MLNCNSSKLPSIILIVSFSTALAFAQAQSEPVIVPEGTRVVMVLKSGIHTTSGIEGAGLYLETVFPVIQQNRIVIPARTPVQGVVVTNAMPGHIDRVSELTFRFTTMIFPDNSVVSIDGVLLSIPGAKNVRVRNEEGKLQPVDQVAKVVAPAIGAAVGGAVISSKHASGNGILKGAGLGALLGAVMVMVRQGDDIDLPRGTYVEMILKVPLALDPDQAARNAQYVTPPVTETDTRTSATSRGARDANPMPPVPSPVLPSLLPMLLGGF